MRVEQFLTGSATRFPDKVALVAGGRRLTYRELDDLSSRLAASLSQRGIVRGDRVVIFMDNSWEAVVAIFAALKVGAVFSPINPSTKSGKLAYVLNNCRAAGLVTQAKLVPAASQALSSAPSVRLAAVAGKTKDALPEGAVSFESMLAEASAGDAPLAPGISLDLAMLVYTSGSTGFPKGVMMTHGNVVAAATSITTYLGNTPDDIILNALPISFDYGLYQVLMSAKIGATLVLEKSFTFPYAIFQKIAAERVTGFPIVPTMAALILQMKDLSPGALSSLRYITNTAAALPPAHIMRLQELFPQTLIFSMYGLTECKRCTYLPPAELRKRPGSVGIAIPDTEAYVVNDAGDPVGPGVVGELVIRGPHVMQGYWENPEATERALRPGRYPWESVLHTGDFFQTDDEGFLYFVGRKDDIIKTRGEKVSPKEVENVIYALSGVREVAVIGVEDAIYGMAVKAVVVLAAGAELSEDDLVRHCAKNLEDYMVPKFIEFRDALPKTSTGKISRREVASDTLEPVE